MRAGSPSSCNRIISASCSSDLRRYVSAKILIMRRAECHVPPSNVDLSAEQQHCAVSDAKLCHGGFRVVQFAAFVRDALFEYWDIGLAGVG